MTKELFNSHLPLPLESGEHLPEFNLAYTTYGNLNADRSNVIWVIHALTGDSNVV
ncbi:MAG: homoserine O-acetyltransferase, partial [Algoriphagus sp.]